MNACFKAFKTNFAIAWRSPNALAASRSFLHEVTAAKAELAPPSFKLANRTKMTSSSNEQDWYVCMHVSEQRKGRPDDVGSFWCVNISNPVYESNSRLRLERIRLPPSQAKVRTIGSYNARREILIKNSVTNTVQSLQHKSDYCDVMATMGTKVYVMMTNRDNKESTSFQAYDFRHEKWTTLPTLPAVDRFRSSHFAWGHKIGLCDLSNLRLLGPSESYVFDTIEEKWRVPEVSLPPLSSAVEFSGFLIGVSHDRGYAEKPISIVAYKIDDENGLPDPYTKHVLDDELWELFYPPLTVSEYGSSLHRLGDDKVVLVSSMYADISDRSFVVMAVFRVSVSTVSGIPMISAALEHKQVYNLANDGDRQHYEELDVGSSFLMQNAPSCCTSVSNMELKWDNQPLQEEEDEEEEKELLGRTSEHQDNNDDVATKANRSVVEWDEQLKEKSLHVCFVENRTDTSVSYTVKAIKFSDLIGLNSKLHQTASTSGFHLPCLPSCGLFGSQILFAGGGNQEFLRELEPIVDEPYSDIEYDEDVEVAQQAPINKSIYSYDVNSTDQIIKRFPRSFKGMKPQPILAEVEGKLYALAVSPMPKHMNPGPCFEVFDPTKKQWSPLPDPPTYTKYQSLGNFHAIVGSNLLSWCGGYIDGIRSRLSPGVFRFDMAAADKDWRLISNSGVLSGVFGDNWTEQHDNYDGISIAVDTGDGDFVFFGYKSFCHHIEENHDIKVHLISREFDDVVRLPDLVMPKNVACLLTLLEAKKGGRSSFVHLGGQRVCLIVSSPFSGPYSRTVSQFDEVDKMSIVVLVFEFQVSEDRKSVAADFVFHQVLDYFDSNTDVRRNPKTSTAHMVGAFLV